MSQTRSTAPETKPGTDTKRPPGPRTLSPLTNAVALQHDPIRFASDIWQRYGDVVHFRCLFWPAYVLYHPDQVKCVLQEHHRNYNKNFPIVLSLRFPLAPLPLLCHTELTSMCLTFCFHQFFSNFSVVQKAFFVSFSPSWAIERLFQKFGMAHAPLLTLAGSPMDGESQTGKA